MAVIYQTTDLIGSGIQINLGAVDYDSLFVNSGVLIASTSTYTVTGSGYGQLVRVLGSVSAYSSAVYMSGESAFVIVEEGGSIYANNSGYTGGSAVRVTGASSVVVNYGRISGGNGVSLDGTNNALYNYGDIDGTEQAGYYNHLTAVQLGSIVYNDTNSTYVENHGNITGTYYSIMGDANYYDNTYETKDEVVNFGTLSGHVYLATREDSVINGGLIIGDVYLESGDDVYKGRQDGFVTGLISGGSGIDILTGASGVDTIDGGSDDDVIRGRDGDDDLSGGTGIDLIYGGRGDDMINGGGGDANKLYGGRGNDIIQTGAGGDLVRAGAGDDTVTGHLGADTLYGGADDDYLAGAEGFDTLHGETGSDTLEGGASRDYLYGGKGDDVISGDGGSDRIYGGKGDDVMTGGGGDDRFVFNYKSGYDVITDFKNGSDKMDFRAFGIGIGVVNGAAFAIGNDVVIDMSAITGEVGAMLILQGFEIANLNGGDFLF